MTPLNILATLLHWCAAPGFFPEGCSAGQKPVVPPCRRLLRSRPPCGGGRGREVRERGLWNQYESVLGWPVIPLAPPEHRRASDGEKHCQGAALHRRRRARLRYPHRNKDGSGHPALHLREPPERIVHGHAVPKRRGQGPSNLEWGSSAGAEHSSVRASTPGEDVSMENNRRPSLRWHEICGIPSNTHHFETGCTLRPRWGLHLGTQATTGFRNAHPPPAQRVTG